jgi:hypothetical protein
MTWGSARSALRYQGTHPTFGSDGKVVASVQYWDYVGKKHTVHFQYSSPVWAFKAPANGGNLPYYMTSHPDIFFARC